MASEIFVFFPTPFLIHQSSKSRLGLFFLARIEFTGGVMYASITQIYFQILVKFMLQSCQHKMTETRSATMFDEIRI